MQVVAVHNFAKFTLRHIVRLMGPIHVYGLENVPKEGPVLLASNHQSYLDPIVIAARFPRPMQAVAKKELFRIPVFGRLIDLIGAFPVDQQGPVRAAIKASLEVLKQGKPLLIFVEGHRTRGPLGEPQPGVAMLAHRSGAPIVPVLVTGTHNAFSPDHPGPHRSRFTVTFGKPMCLDAGEGGHPDLQADARKVMDAIAALRSDTPDPWPEIHEEDLPPPRG